MLISLSVCMCVTPSHLSLLFFPFCRFVNVLVYYGLSLGVSRLGTDLYLTQFVFGVIEIPARSLVLLFLPFSRRLTQSAFLALGGVACLLTLLVPEGTLCVCVFNVFSFRINIVSWIQMCVSLCLQDIFKSLIRIPSPHPPLCYLSLFPPSSSPSPPQSTLT